MSMLALHVFHVGLVRASLQMPRIDARWRVAAMHWQLTIIEWTMHKLERYAVCDVLASFDAYVRQTLVIECAFP